MEIKILKIRLLSSDKLVANFDICVGEIEIIMSLLKDGSGYILESSNTSYFDRHGLIKNKPTIKLSNRLYSELLDMCIHFYKNHLSSLI